MNQIKMVSGIMISKESDISPPDWVISDTHFGHANILNYCPWRKTWSKNILDHDEQIILHWQRIVKPSDVTLHLGDFSLAGPDAISAYRMLLPGRIILIRGNHDRSRSSMLAAGFDVVTSVVKIKDGERTYICRHDPASFTHSDFIDAHALLHGHCHGNGLNPEIAKKVGVKSVDCSMDAMRSIFPIKWSALRL